MSPDRLTGEMVDQMTAEEQQFYFYGFRTILRRFVRMTVTGWVLSAVGAACLLVFWKSLLPHGVFDLLLSLAVVVAGVIVVQTNVTALQSYVTVAIPNEQSASGGVFLLRAWMREVAEGGWRDANAVLHRLPDRVVGQQGELP